MPEALPTRKRLPETRVSITHKFKIEESKFYITVGLYEDGAPGEVFLKSGKAMGSFEHGILDGFSILLSIALQHGVPLNVIVGKLKHMRFEPSGITESKTQELRFADSILDYIAKWLTIKFGEKKNVDSGNNRHDNDTGRVDFTESRS
jgi:ribonucleoside-diphosphate reductase alpha chain